jgi:uncharacterized protein (DUF302 family)
MQPEESQNVPSRFEMAETIGRLVASITARGSTVVDKIDHAAAAASVGLTLRPTTVVIFGNPTVGTALMQANQSIGLELPLKVLVWEDATGKTWLSHFELRSLAVRYLLPATAEAVITKLDGVLRTIVAEASGQLIPTPGG